MPKLDLTDRFCSTIKTTRNEDYFDAKTTGLGLRVSPSGVKAWSVIFTSPKDGKRSRLSLGHYPATSLARARTLAIEARGKVEAGTDPRDESNPSAVTVGMLAENYIEKHARTIKTGKDLARRLRHDVLPVIGGVKLADLHRRDVHRVLDRIKDRGSPQSAAKAQGDIHSMLKWAIARGDLEHDPMMAMEAPEAANARERFLTEYEIAALWQAWPDVLPAPVVMALKIALVTGQRIGEVTGMMEDEIDLAKATWTIPPERAKNGTQHVVPLSHLALDLIRQARRSGINGRLFPLSSMKIGQQLIRYRERLPVSDWAAHDLRRTVCTHLAKMGFSPLIIGSVVNHRQVTKQGVTLGVYVQYDYAKEKREALDAWAERLTAIVRGDMVADVIHLHRVDRNREAL